MATINQTSTANQAIHDAKNLSFRLFVWLNLHSLRVVAAVVVVVATYLFRFFFSCEKYIHIANVWFNSMTMLLPLLSFYLFICLYF